MENKDFKRIPMPNKQLPDEMLDSVNGGQKNVDENGNFITDRDKCVDWYNATRSKTYHNICPICRRYMYECTWNNTDGNLIWYMFWYNRLYCTTEGKWHDNELY